MKTRQDAWTKENDELLAETVLHHIREGSTQLNAFEEVGDKLNRTSAACGFRWNAVVREKYEKEIAMAKKQRKQKQRALNLKTRPLYTPPAPTFDLEEFEQVAPIQSSAQTINLRKEVPNITMEDVIEFLEQFDSTDSKTEQLTKENDRLKKENKELASKNEELEKEIEKAQENYDMIQGDYQALVQIMDRARKMVLFNDEEQPRNAFKMDRNGNLERIAK